MFTDLVGFTEYTATQGDGEAVRALGVQDEIVRSALPGDARVVKELGDGLLLWFSDAPNALLTCLELLVAFERAADDDRFPLWVRMGAHWGEPTHRGVDLVGHAVNVAARIAGVAAPGELLCSESFVVAAGEPAAASFVELGPVVMKGLPVPVPLFRVERVPQSAATGWSAGREPQT